MSRDDYLILGGPGTRERLPRHCKGCQAELGNGIRDCPACGHSNPPQTCRSWPGMHVIRCYAEPGDVYCTKHRKIQDEFLRDLGLLRRQP